jgi:O-acetyl-ADP-ribose deacetylase (regulator of RNase III)
MPHRIQIVEGDITRLDVDAIVNAANKSLLGGGGVDGAIHRGAGPELLEACAKLGGCDTGEAKVTPGFNLPARYVIHTVGPVWSGGERGEDRLLAACYRNALALALEHGLASIAYPAISTGAYGFPPDRAARIALRTVIAALTDNETIERIVFCCFGAASRAHHEAALTAAKDKRE